jgi:hypothetical protein
MAPLAAIFDTLALLSVAQHIEIIATALLLIVGSAAWRVWRGDGGMRAMRSAAQGLALLLGVYAAGTLVPRPMAALRVDDPDMLIVDFHSHTSHSHDGRKSFDAEANRAWHIAAGFDAGYITDHDRFAAAAAAMQSNPARAGDGYVSLSGVETRYRRQAVVLLGIDSVEFAAVKGAYLDSVRSQAAVESAPPLPVMIQTIPANLSRVPVADSLGRPGVIALEASDGAPRGIAQGVRDSLLIRTIADSLNLALVAASNNHGWGSTAVSWSVVTLPGWRAMSPDELDRGIQRAIRNRGDAPVIIVERNVAEPASSTLVHAAMLPLVAWHMLTGLSAAERVSWLAWAWLIAGLSIIVRRRRLALERAGAPNAEIHSLEIPATELVP